MDTLSKAADKSTGAGAVTSLFSLVLKMSLWTARGVVSVE
jgi:hypothetical protein